MSFKQWTSFWERQQEAFDLHLEARQNSSFVEDFTAFDPVNGPIVKGTERKIMYGSLGISSGIGLSILANFLLHLRRKPPTSQYLLLDSVFRLLEVLTQVIEQFVVSLCFCLLEESALSQLIMVPACSCYLKRIEGTHMLSLTSGCRVELKKASSAFGC